MHRLRSGRPGSPAAGAAAVAAALVLLLVLAACGRHSDAARVPGEGEPAAAVTVTADFGAVPLARASVPPGGTVLDALRGMTDVRTGYGGRYVERMYGRGSDLTARRDWFFYVDGVLGDRSAADVTLRDGTAVWWDHRHWGGQMDAWAVVGAWPRPWAGRPVAADPPLRAVLAAHGARPAGDGAPWRVRVGSDADLRTREPAWARAAGDPGAAGLTATVDDGRITALDAAGERREPVPGGRALIAAVPSGGVPSEGTVLVVVGLDDAAARAAADALAADPGIVRDRYAVVLDGAGRPLRAAGRGSP